MRSNPAPITKSHSKQELCQSKNLYHEGHINLFLTEELPMGVFPMSWRRWHLKMPTGRICDAKQGTLCELLYLQLK